MLGYVVSIDWCFSNIYTGGCISSHTADHAMTKGVGHGVQYNAGLTGLAGTLGLKLDIDILYLAQFVVGTASLEWKRTNMCQTLICRPSRSTTVYG